MTHEGVKERASCSCMAVNYSPEILDGGLLRERWICETCGTQFVKRCVMDYEIASSEKKGREEAIEGLIEKVRDAWSPDVKDELAERLQRIMWRHPPSKVPKELADEARKWAVEQVQKCQYFRMDSIGDVWSKDQVLKRLTD